MNWLNHTGLRLYGLTYVESNWTVSCRWHTVGFFLWVRTLKGLRSLFSTSIYVNGAQVILECMTLSYNYLFPKTTFVHNIIKHLFMLK